MNMTDDELEAYTYARAYAIDRELIAEIVARWTRARERIDELEERLDDAGE